MTVNEERVQTLMAMFKRRGVVRPAFEIYGGVAGLFDYGPVGIESYAELRKFGFNIGLNLAILWK